MFKGILILAVMLLVCQSHAYYNLLPKGTRQSLLGNNGIALTENDGAGAYNPASIVGIKGPTLSASGSVLSISRLGLSGSSLLDRSDAPSLDINSAYITALFTTDNFNYGFFFSNEQNINLSKYLEFNFTGNAGSTNIDISLQLNKLGMLIAAESGNFFMD